VHIERFGAVALIFDEATQFSTQINDSINAEPLQFFQSIMLGLTAAVEEIVNLAEIRNARYINFIGECWLAHCRRLIPVCATAERGSRGKQG
jgi:hypothetical protein